MTMRKLFEDVSRECADCHAPYTWRASDQKYADQQGWLPPKRCPRCRAAVKARLRERNQSAS